MKIVNDIRITKAGVKKIDELLDYAFVDDYHKNLLNAIKSRMPKNVSKSDCEIFEMISKAYK
jgi:hypothetical protein